MSITELLAITPPWCKLSPLSASKISTPESFAAHCELWPGLKEGEPCGAEFGEQDIYNGAQNYYM